MIKLLNKEESTYEYLIYDLETEYINGLRRVLYSGLKSHRIDKDKTTIIKNNTNINNEIIIHRLTLIPIKSEKNLHFKLNKKNKTNKIINIYSDDLESDNKEYEIIKGILIHKLKPNEELNLLTTTKESTGKEHNSYRPFSVCYFKIMKFVYIKENIDKKKITNIKKK